MAEHWEWIAKGGMTTLECEPSEDGGIYMSAVSCGYSEDNHALIALSRSEAIGLAGWILRTTEPLLVAPPVTKGKAESNKGDALRRWRELVAPLIKSYNAESVKQMLNQCCDDYDLTSNDTRRGD